MSPHQNERNLMSQHNEPPELRPEQYSAKTVCYVVGITSPLMRVTEDSAKPAAKPASQSLQRALQ